MTMVIIVMVSKSRSIAWVIRVMNHNDDGDNSDGKQVSVYSMGY